MAIKYKDEEFKEKVYEKFGNKFEIIGAYKNMKTSILIRCNGCGSENLVSPEKLLYKEDPIWCDKCVGDVKILAQIDKIKSDFPRQHIGGLLLYIDNVEHMGKIKRKRYYVDFHDSDNYKYRLEYGGLISAIETRRTIRRYFQGNPYTCHNIQNYLQVNGISMRLTTPDLCVGDACRLLNFTDKNGNEVSISWNSISNNTERYIDKNYDLYYRHKMTKEMTKEDAAQTIYRMQSRLDRPICQDDFIHPTGDMVGIRTVRKFWKEVSSMQKDLGLTITGERSTKVPPDNCVEMIKFVCDTVYIRENRKTIVIDDFRKYGVVGAKVYDDSCKKNGSSLRRTISGLGFALQQAGNGFNHTYDDGEKVVSMLEYDFSNFLRDNGLTYGKDYFRDVKYKTLTTEYEGNMNCDYEIHKDGRIFYVEIAGILGNPSHEKCYRDNIQIESKSKEKYRLDLMAKKNIFEKEGLEHYILLKSEMNESIYSKILDGKNLSVA